jgi:hypothetical protein
MRDEESVAMTLFDVLAILALAAAMEARNCMKQAKIWDAIVELYDRKLDVEP